jgi:hypothetical protein
LKPPDPADRAGSFHAQEGQGGGHKVPGRARRGAIRLFTILPDVSRLAAGIFRFLHAPPSVRAIGHRCQPSAEPPPASPVYTPSPAGIPESCRIAASRLDRQGRPPASWQLPTRWTPHGHHAAGIAAGKTPRRLTPEGGAPAAGRLDGRHAAYGRLGDWSTSRLKVDRAAGA